MKDEITRIAITGLNETKEKRLEAANGRVLFTLSKYIDQFDRKLVDHFETAKEQWDSLYLKYSKSYATSRKQDLHQITGFKFGIIDDVPVDMTISTALAHLVSARRRIRESNPNMVATFTKEVLLDYLLNGLPPS
ncbi:hypothetical protein K3495_g10599 [Podosphaera aphanis]|nr:hypothetical protein K3495_g10599 [Podosphaera aphanis]